MTQPPRGRASGLMLRGDWLRPLMLGTMLAIGVIAVYLLLLASHRSIETARASALVTMLSGQMLLVLVERSTHVPVWRQSLRENPRIAPILIGTALMLVAGLYVPSLAAAFRIAPPPLSDLGIAIGVGILTTLWLEPFKRPIRL